jgi:hypothetical protein
LRSGRSHAISFLRTRQLRGVASVVSGSPATIRATSFQEATGQQSVVMSNVAVTGWLGLSTKKPSASPLTLNLPWDTFAWAFPRLSPQKVPVKLPRLRMFTTFGDVAGFDRGRESRLLVLGFDRPTAPDLVAGDRL